MINSSTKSSSESFPTLMEPGSISAVFVLLEAERAGLRDDFLTRPDDGVLMAAPDDVFLLFDMNGDSGLKPPAAAAFSAAEQLLSRVLASPPLVPPRLLLAIRQQVDCFS